jgi:hypothetical protein
VKQVKMNLIWLRQTPADQTYQHIEEYFVNTIRHRHEDIKLYLILAACSASLDGKPGATQNGENND